MAVPRDRLMQLLREPAARDLLDGRFSIECEAGIGGMGIVYRAVDQTTGALVALKVLRKAVRGGARRFANEIEALERLSDPAIVRYVAHGILDDGEPYLAMEWVEGESLSDRLRDGPLTIPEALAVGKRIASALRAAHAVGLVHRDIKPGNVLLPGGVIEHAKVADFGISRFVAECQPRSAVAGVALAEAPITTDGMGLGTLGYASPEQVRGARDIDGRADLFSLGCLLFRCLTNEEAFAGAEALTVIAKLVLEEPRRAKALRAEVPAELDALVAQLLAKDRNQRPASADAVLLALDDIEKGRHSPQTGAFRRRAQWLVVGIGAMGLGISGIATLSSPSSSEASLSSPASPTTSFSDPASSDPILITDLPASAKCRPDAVRDYREGLQALREATAERAYKVFERAMAKDPACPEILLRVLQTARGIRPIVEQRDLLRRVLVDRDALRERDRVLLDSSAAAVASDPPDLVASAEIMSEGARRFPRDAELAQLAAIAKVLLVKTAREMEPVLELAERAATLDPQFAEAWSVLGWSNERLDRREEEGRAYTRCREASPAAVGCIRDHVTLLRRSGRCEEAEALVRQWLARDPSSDRAHQALAALLSAEGAPRESIEEVLRMRWALLSRDEERKERVQLHDRAKLEAWTGHFEQALGLGEELERRASNDPHIEAHLRAVRIPIDALLEMGRSTEAASLAERFLQRKIAWTSSPLSGDRSETGAGYYEPILLGAAVEQGRLAPGDWRARAHAWEQRAQTTTNTLTKMNAFETWTLRWGSAVGSKIDAAEAMQNVPRVELADGPLLPTPIWFHPGLLQAYEGRLRLAAGDPARAASLLQAAAQSCQGLDQPFLNTRAHLWLGLANEKLGKNKEACDAYRIVQRRWGKSVPRSVTASEAARHSRALGCPT